MTMAGEPSLLRPLSLGEIFDRAVTLYVRNFVPFTGIVLVIVLPLAIVQYFAGAYDSSTFAQILQQVQHPGKTPPPANTSVASVWGFGSIAIAVVLSAFVAVAIGWAVGAIYRGEMPQWRASYAVALRRTGAIIATLLCEMAIFLLAIIAGAFGMGLTFVLAFLLVRANPALGVAALIAAIVVALLWFAALMLCYVAFGFSYNAIGVEGAGPAAAIGSAFARLFNHTELLRALLVCLALMAMYMGIIVVSVAAQALLESANLHVLSVLVSSLLSLVTTSFLGILLAVYYFDVRVRREGLDLQASIDSLHPVPTTL